MGYVAYIYVYTIMLASLILVVLLAATTADTLQDEKVM